MSETESKNISHVLVLIAMEAEAKPFIKALDLLPFSLVTPNLPCVAYQGVYHNCKVTVVTNGVCVVHNVDNVGTTPAAIAAFAGINELKPDLVINAGTAGGFKRCGGNIGDAYIGTHFRHHDRRIPIPPFIPYGIGNHKSFECKNLIEALNLKSGVVSTANSLDHTPKDMEMMMSNEAVVKEMEAAAIAWVAELSATPFLALKVVTDIVDGEELTQDEFLRNLATAAAILQDKLLAVINFVTGRALNQL